MNIQIQTTSYCSATCIICPYPESWHRNHPGIMNDNVFYRIIDQISKYPINKLCPYFQNDPFMDKNIFKRIEVIKKQVTFNLLEVSTNAMAMTPDKALDLAEAVKDIPHDIWLSFHGTDARTHDNIMGIDFNKCLHHIVNLLKIAQNIPLKIAIVGAGLPQDDGLRHDFNFLKEEFLAFWNRIFLENNISKRPRVVYFRYHDRAGTIQRNSINMRKTVRPDLTNFYCPRIDQWLHFLYNGDLVLCCDDYHREQVFGNIMTADLEDIFCGEKYLTLKAQVLGQVSSPDDFICKRCINPGG